MEDAVETKLIDLHNHTEKSTSGFWHTIEHSPIEAVKQAKEINLDGIAITDHNTLKGLDEALNAAEKYGIIVIPGVEISAKDIFTPHPRHVIALGINPEITQEQNIPKNQSIEKVIKWIHDQGALAIAAHPFNPEVSRFKQEPFSLNKRLLEKHSDKIDAIETMNLLGNNFPAQYWAKKNNIPQLGSSDSHHLKQIGLVTTKIFGSVKNWQDIIKAIKYGQTEPFMRASLEILHENSYPNIVFKPKFQEKFPNLSQIFYSYNKN
ncbi:MAG: PHP-associated domain-containing protein [Bacteriovorax sp.]|nr:PHP-associated domain-containing protein [Bacteriovorax sp.]